MSVKMFSVKLKADLIAYRKTHNKTQTAAKFGCSIRTVGRIESEYSKPVAKTKVSQAVKASVAPAVVVSGSDVMSMLKAKAQQASGRIPAPVKFKGTIKVVDLTQPECMKTPVVVAPRNLVWTMGSNYINIIEEGVTFVANNTHPNFEKAKISIFNGDIEKALELINIKRGIEKFSKGKIKIENEEVFYGDLKIDTGLTRRIIAAMSEGKDFEFLVNFFENLMLNPSRRAVNELFGFLEHNDIEITEDGQFLAWKRVNANYTDMHSGKFSNKPGTVVEIPRNMVDEDPNRTCSAGLHIAAKSYLPHYGGGRGVIIQCKVHPRDVVAVPVDYNNAKMRTCRYEVMKDVTKGFSHY